MKQRLWLSVIFMCLSFSAWTQGFVENALLFSRSKPGGSARIQALGGAQVALGGDYSSALSNPAGLGFYNRSEFTFSPALTTYKVNSTHLGTKENNSSSKLNIPGLSLVYHYPQEQGKFLGGSFGVSLTRTNDFNSEFHYGGIDNTSSIVDYFKETAQGYSINPLASPYDNTPLLNYDFPEGLAYLTYIITPYNEDPGNTSPSAPYDYINYYSELDTLPGEIRTLNRNEHVKTSGAQYQWSFAYGGNYNDKLFFGASIGITSLRYKFSRNYRESDYAFSTDTNYDPLDYLRLKESITLDGSGVNLTLGIIYRPIRYVQVGVSFVTPTYYQITDSYTATLQTSWNDNRGSIEESSLEAIVSEYTLRTPLKFSTGATVFLGKYGFITGDLEFINYGQAKYDSDISGISFSSDNDAVRFYYTNVVNYRVGAELRYEIFRLRGGYAHQSNPIKNSAYTDQSIQSISVGAGVKLAKFSIDFAWLNSKGKSSYSPYVFQNGSGPVANLKNSVSSGMITVGYSF